MNDDMKVTFDEQKENVGKEERTNEVEQDLVDGTTEEEVDDTSDMEVENAEENHPEIPSGSSFLDMADAIDNIGRVLEMQRNVVDAESEIESACEFLGIKKEDQDIIHGHMKAFVESGKRIQSVTKNIQELNTTFFLRPDHSVIKFINPLEKKEEDAKGNCSNNSRDEFQAKVNFVNYLHGYYDLEVRVQQDIDKMNKDMEKFKEVDVADASASVAALYQSDVELQIADAQSIQDDTERERRLSDLYIRRSAYTFERYISLLANNKNMAANTIREMRNDDNVSAVGAAYRKRKDATGTVSSLYGILSNDLKLSIEAQFLTKDEYVEGYENLFGFGLIRFFAKEDWNNPLIRQLHNATVILLTNLQNRRLTEPTREEIVKGIRTVWSYFLPEISKKP